MSRTLPPPEWVGREVPRSAASLLLERAELDAAVARHSGPRAELSALFALLERSAGDELAERAAAVTLARSLATRGTQLEVATRLARRALVLSDDGVLREELAGWFVSLGEPALAAATLRPLVPSGGGAGAAAVLVRIGVLLARAGEARAASDACAAAAAADAADPVAVELRASLAAWAPEALAPERAAEDYLVAAERREARGERAAAFENLLRAFAIAPGHAPAAEHLAAALLARGRPGAADEVRREHAGALEVGARAAHLRRMRQAVKESDLPRALGAALDAGLDAEIDLRSVLAAIDPETSADTPLGIDGLLERANLHELLAARVELASDFLAGRERARARLALARLYTGPLGRPDRAVEAWIEALVADPGCEGARDALRRHAAVARDQAPLIEALIRVADGTSAAGRAERVQCLRELAVLTEERSGEPSLALWAQRRIAALSPEAGELAAAEERLAPRVRAADETLAGARAELAHAKSIERIAPLVRIAMILKSRPDEADSYLEVLAELVERAPEDRVYAVAMERVLARLGRDAELEAFLRAQAERAGSGVERARLRLALSSSRRRRGDAAGALAELEPLLEEPGAHGAAWSYTLLFAAQAGDSATRARALARIAGQLAPSLRAVLMAVVAEDLLAASDVDGARSACEQACNADPSLARPAAARARVGAVVGGRWGAEAVERAMSIIVPRPQSCAALAAIYDRIGEPLLAVTWMQRLGTLRPGDLEAVRGRLTRALGSEDGSRLADTLAWVLSQPQSLTPLSGVIAEALERLAGLAPGRAGALARRALDVLGPRDPRLRTAALGVADQVGERGLGIAVIERWLATGSLGAERAPVLLDLARRRKLSGDADGAAFALCRALSEGASALDVLVELDSALPTRSSDGEISLLRARAEALSALPEADSRGTARAWRELGAALWDLADDRSGALRAWERGLALDAERGPEHFASDLLAFGGEELSLARLRELAEKRGDTPEAARFHALVAGIALGAGRAAEAFESARRTLELDPTRSDAIVIAERAAGPSELDELEALYDRLAALALGQFGERAIRYRAARQLERRALPERAFRHAEAAFEAVPSEGVVFVTLVRLAERTQQRAELVRAIERVAQRCSSAGERATWLRRAALFAGESEEGRRQRVDVLLRALAVSVDAELVRALASALSALVENDPDERAAAELRFERAAGSVLERGDGPEGARVAIEIALAALGTFGGRALALRALTRASVCDGDIEDFARLDAHAAELGGDELAAGFVTGLLEKSRDRYASFGVPLFELGARIAEARGDRSSATELLVAAAERHPEHAELVRRAELSARELGEPELIARVLDVMPDSGRFRGLMALAVASERAGDVTRALSALERAHALELDIDERRELVETSLELYRRAGRHEHLERLLAGELARPELALALVPRVASELSALMGARGRPAEALDVLTQALERVADHPGMLNDAAELARQAADRERLAWALAKLVDGARERTQELVWLRELAAVLSALGDETSALERFQQLHALDPEDPDALMALERDAERRADYDGVARLLERRASLAGRPEDVRRLRLRRAVVLEHRLGRPDDARAELEALLSATGDQLEVLRVLADLHERLGEPLRAAPLWLRASALGADREAAAELTEKACQAYLAGGDVEGALRVLEGMGVWAERERVLALRVEAERRRQNPAGLAGALEELASVSRETPERRAELLFEAARASLAAGAADQAFERAERAARLAPAHPLAKPLARGLPFRDRAPGEETEAQALLDELSGAGALHDPLLTELGAVLTRYLERSRVEAAPPAVPGPDIVPVAPETFAEPQDSRPLRAHVVIDADDDAPARELTVGQSPHTVPAVSPSIPSVTTDVAIDSVPPSVDPPSPRRSQISVSGAFVATSEAESELHAALLEGSREAGVTLLHQLDSQPARAHDRVSVLRQLLLLSPGDPFLLEALANAARDDHNLVYATAIAHVLEVVRPLNGPIEPPAFDEDRPTPADEVRALLFRELTHPALETMALVWETAEQLFRRDPGAYGITGLERVQTQAPTPLGRIYATAARALGAHRTPLFQRRSAGPITIGVALLSPPAVVLSGDVQQETPELAFHLGAMLAAAAPQLVMLFGLPESQARSVLRALGFAFGPARPDASGVGTALNLAEMLWQNIPPRSQRRLRELCHDPQALDYEGAMTEARIAARRAGYFVCGDFGIAVREVCAEEGLNSALLSTQGGLAALCEQSPSVRSLYALSLSAQYADTRFRGARTALRPA